MPEEVPANVPVALPNKGFPRRFGRYILEKNLSRGGMGEVFLAQPSGARRRCVIKTIRGDLTGDKEFVGRFADEAKIMVRMMHDNIISVFDCGKVGTDYYIAMEYMHGKDLGDVLDRAYERGEPMPKDIGLYIALRMLRGLDYVHNLKDEKGRLMRLVHRDISPQNVLISFEGDIKLIDFGLARTDLLPGRTQGALAVGKYGYMSPEQARHEEIDGRADLYSFGIMLFEVFTGDRLVDEQDQATLWARVLNPKHRKASAVIPDIGEDIDQLIATAVQVRAEDRYQDAQDMARFIKHKMRTKPCSRDRLLKYLRYLYPNDDFSPPALPSFSNIPERTEKSTIIAMSEERAMRVFGDGELPVEWTMQIDMASLKALRKTRTPKEQEADRRRKPVTSIVRDEQTADGPVDEESTGELYVEPPLEAPVLFHEGTDDAPTAISAPTELDGDEEATRFEKPPTRRPSPDTKEVLGEARSPSNTSSFGDDEATVMMTAPPQHRARSWDESDEEAHTEFLQPTKVNEPRTLVPGEEKPKKRAIQEKAGGQKAPGQAQVGRGTRRPGEPQVVIKRSEAPAPMPPRPKPKSDDFNIPEQPATGPNFLLLGLIMMGFTIILLLLVLIFLK